MITRESIMKHATLAVLVLATVVFALPAVGQDIASMYCDLRLGPGAAPCVSIPYTVTGVSILPEVVKTDSNCPGAGYWREAHFDIDLHPISPATLPRIAYIVVEYQDTPSGWTVDIGDSPSDNGYGGGSDSKKAAEVQVVDQLLSVFDDNTGVYGQVDNMLTQQMSLLNSSLKFTITDQTLTIGPPWSRLWTPVTKLLYTLPDPAETTCPYCIHAAFNHVVDSGTPRAGCGVRSVTISTGPGV
jgi:hypothetical protein